MGLLDEAIREHLELKRRRGADSTELTRQEHEAFGPTGRGEEELPAESDPGHELHAALDEPASFAAEAGAHAAEGVGSAEPTRLHVAEPPVEEHLPAPADLHEAELEREPPRPHGDPADHFPHPAEPESEPHPEPPAAPEEPPAATSQPTREFDLDEVRAAGGAEPEIVLADEEPEAEAEDVLEETPEFLQETPEHDRLWFEQRPPRDFDF
jgi:hypothetical protein